MNQKLLFFHLHLQMANLTKDEMWAMMRECLDKFAEEHLQNRTQHTPRQHEERRSRGGRTYSEPRRHEEYYFPRHVYGQDQRSYESRHYEERTSSESRRHGEQHPPRDFYRQQERCSHQPRRHGESNNNAARRREQSYPAERRDRVTSTARPDARQERGEYSPREHTRRSDVFRRLGPAVEPRAATSALHQKRSSKAGNAKANAESQSMKSRCPINWCGSNENPRLRTHALTYHLPACFKETEKESQSAINTLFDKRNEFWVEVAHRTSDRNRPLDLVNKVIREVPKDCAIPPELHNELKLYSKEYAQSEYPFVLHNVQPKALVRFAWRVALQALNHVSRADASKILEKLGGTLGQKRKREYLAQARASDNSSKLPPTGTHDPAQTTPMEVELTEPIQEANTVQPKALEEADTKPGRTQEELCSQPSCSSAVETLPVSISLAGITPPEKKVPSMVIDTRMQEGGRFYKVLWVGGTVEEATWVPAEELRAAENLIREFEDDEFTVEEILDDRLQNGQQEYFLKWKGYPEEHNSWESEKNMNCAELIRNYWRKKAEAVRERRRAEFSVKKKKFLQHIRSKRD